MTEQQRRDILKSQQGELNAVYMYQKLAEKMKDQEVKQVLLELAKDEGHHAALFFNLSHEKLEVKKGQGNLISFLQRIVGWQLLFKLMSVGEYQAVTKYQHIVSDFPETKSVQMDEKRHGDILLSLREKLKEKNKITIK